ncbi:MAG: RNA 2',3'-cyclic phosphodiesterase [Spirochaetales bacterium]|uniref:RNA 2',3'-cyclic phosphodiesterase n=1 Tax=Candidatus Thalassospirochaeta sargassi TaxID=3119039 RepID=A0AAJ1MM60_9SPIO|nr:RNA 2',3'-cyclic phosphodiesterase [Spirochaetales bacterium]
MRIFYAVNFDDKTSEMLQKLQNDLREKVIRGRWAALENLHLTLHFVGEIESDELPIFKEALEKAAAAVQRFSIRFTSYGSFRQGKQDLIYIKTKNTGDVMKIMSDILKKELQRGDMKSFTPHVTLVRRGEINYSTLKVLKKQRFELPAVEIKSVELMESRKINGRLTYTTLHSVSLK